MKKGKRILAWLLSLAMVITSVNLPTLTIAAEMPTETVSENEVVTADEEDVNVASEESDDENLEAETGLETEAEPFTDQYGLSNPVHDHNDANDYTDNGTWSYVYFGSYPQSEVKEDLSF